MTLLNWNNESVQALHKKTEVSNSLLVVYLVPNDFQGSNLVKSIAHDPALNQPRFSNEHNSGFILEHPNWQSIIVSQCEGSGFATCKRRKKNSI